MKREVFGNFNFLESEHSWFSKCLQIYGDLKFEVPGTFLSWETIDCFTTSANWKV